jgi:predicted O-methyltransferase YrrM
MKIKILFLTNLFVLTCAALSEPEPYRSVEPLPTNLNGFFGGNRAWYLQSIVNTIHPKVVVELGSWLGNSAIFLAKNIDAHATVYAVDHWLGSEEHQTGGFQAMLPTLYRQFLSNVKNVGLTHKIVPVRMSTIEAARLDIKPDMVYVDASHDAESVYQDIMAWYPKLNSGGVMCGDDFNWASVEQGVRRAARELGQVVHAKGGDEPIWWFDNKQ